MIVNRLDYQMRDANTAVGVGAQLLGNACFDPSEIDLAIDMLARRRRHSGAATRSC